MTDGKRSIAKIIKRDGRVVDFDRTKIENAIWKALKATGMPDRDLACKLSYQVVERLERSLKPDEIPTVEGVQDIVEQVLMDNGLPIVAKAYILYRQKRAEIREEKKRILQKDTLDEVDKAFDVNALRVLASRYLRRDEKGRLLETPKQLFTRVAIHVSIPDILYDPRVYDKEGNRRPNSLPQINILEWEGKLKIGRYQLNRYHIEGLYRLYRRLNLQGRMKISLEKLLYMISRGEFDLYENNINIYYNLMVSRKFMPNTPALANFGNPLGMGSACFVLDIDDSLDSIMETLKRAALIFKAGGGVGYNFSKLRPEGDYVSTTSGVACFTPDIRINTDRGMLKIEEIINSNDNIKALTHEGYQPIINKFDNGVQDVYEVITSNGYTIKTTITHKFLTIENGEFVLKPLFKLKTGDYVVLFASECDHDNLNIICLRNGDLELPLDEKLAYLLGMIYANGDIVGDDGHHAINILLNKSDQDIIYKFKCLCLDVFNYRVEEYIVKGRKVELRISHEKFIKTLEKYNLLGDGSGGIPIPELIFKSPKTVISSFIAGYFDGNGYFDGSRILFKSLSKDMCDSLTILLNKLGILTVITPYNYKHGRSEIYRLEIPTHIFKTRFYNKIGKYSIMLKRRGLKSKTNRMFTIPFNIIYKFREPHVRAKISRIIPYSEDRTFRNAIIRLINEGSRLGLSEDELEYLKFLNMVYPVTIKSIKYVGRSKVYNLEVAGAHKLVANGFYVSNSGPVSFMRLFDIMTEVIKQGGIRRGANIGILNINHPDIEKFIKAKEGNMALRNFNISVLVMPDFWEYYRENKQYPLVNPRNGKIVKLINPRLLFDMIAYQAWSNAEPGLIFFDNVNKLNPFYKTLGPILATNPCGEVLLYPNESCNLGSINVWKFVVEGEDGKKDIDWDGLAETVRWAVKFLDNVIDINRYPLPEIEEATLNTRKIGLGVMGLADLLFDLEIPYHSEMGRKFMERLMEFINYHSKLASIELARERGVFPYFNKSFYMEGKLPFEGFYDKKSWNMDWENVKKQIMNHGIRNGYTTVIAPTGSISMICGTSSGIEPQFSLVYEKQVTIGTFYYVDPVFEDKMRQLGIFDDQLLKDVILNRGSIQKIPYIPEKMKRIFVTAMDISPEDHVRALAAIQRWVDSSISKTINMPETSTIDDVKRVFILAHELGVKDLTIYRYGTISEQVLVVSEKREEDLYKTDTHLEARFREATAPTANRKISKCPICNGQIVYQEGCITCISCGWSVCS